MHLHNLHHGCLHCTVGLSCHHHQHNGALHKWSSTDGATEAISSTLGSDLMIGKEAINETDNMDAAHGAWQMTRMLRDRWGVFLCWWLKELEMNLWAGSWSLHLHFFLAKGSHHHPCGCRCIGGHGHIIGLNTNTLGRRAAISFLETFGRICNWLPQGHHGQICIPWEDCCAGGNIPLL